jgi:bifunctional DNA-binding transcriptional regulator/antitoxin component of YhaV-PrlF toxin-antitoxin module
VLPRALLERLNLKPKVVVHAYNTSRRVVSSKSAWPTKRPCLKNGKKKKKNKKKTESKNH